MSRLLSNDVFSLVQVLYIALLVAGSRSFPRRVFTDGRDNLIMSLSRIRTSPTLN